MVAQVAVFADDRAIADMGEHTARWNTEQIPRARGTFTGRGPACARPPSRPDQPKIEDEGS